MRLIESVAFDKPKIEPDGYGGEETGWSEDMHRCRAHFRYLRGSEPVVAAVSLLDGDGELGRAMITQTWAEWVPNLPGWVRLSIGPFQSLVSVEYYDTTLKTDTLTNYETRKQGDYVLCKPKTGFNWPIADDRGDAIKITYTAGFGDASTDVPAGIRPALNLLVGHWFEHREAASEVSLSEAPMAVNALLNRERVGWYG